MLHASSLLLAEVVLDAVPPSYAVGWGTLALINAGLAQGKNRSGLAGLAWFLLSLVLGPFATFVLVAFFDRTGREIEERH